MKPVRWSSLKFMAESPAHYKHVLDNGLEPTSAMKFGSLVHAMVLGRTKPFVIWEGERGAKGWKAFKEQHEGQEILTTAEWERATACADAVKLDPVCGPLIRQGVREQRIEWEIGGRACAGTPDLNGGVLIDLKVTPLASPARFEWHARKMSWHAQAVWYLDGLEKRGESVSDVYLIAVTPKPPHLCVAYLFTERTIDLGRRTWRLLFERLMACEASDQWPGYAQAPIALDMGEVEESLVLSIGGEEVEL